MTRLAMPPRGEIDLGYGRKFNVDGATLLCQDDAEPGRAAVFIYRAKDGGFIRIQQWGWNEFEKRDIEELDAINSWILNQVKGRIHVPFEEAFPNAEVEAA